MKSRPVGEAFVRPRGVIDVVLVAEQRILREGLRKLFEGEAGFSVVADTPDPDDALKSITNLEPHVVIVSLSGRLLAQMMRTLLDLTAASNRARTILLTTTIENGDIARARQLGVSGILLNETSPQLLYDCVRTVAAGHYWIGRERLDDLATRLQQASGTDHQYGLTERELQVVGGVVRGETNRKIADRLSITQDTVKHHLTNVFTKVGVFTRVQLAAFAVNRTLSSTSRARAADSAPPAATRFCRTVDGAVGL